MKKFIKDIWEHRVLLNSIVNANLFEIERYVKCRVFDMLSHKIKGKSLYLLFKITTLRRTFMRQKIGSQTKTI